MSRGYKARKEIRGLPALLVLMGTTVLLVLMGLQVPWGRSDQPDPLGLWGRLDQQARWAPLVLLAMMVLQAHLEHRAKTEP